MSDNDSCLINRALDILGKKWTLHVLNNIFVGNRRYTEILNNTPGLTDKILSQRLRELQNNGILSKIMVKGEKNKNEYVLTNTGRSLNKFFFELAIFSTLNYPKIIFENKKPLLSKAFPFLGKLYMMSKDGTHESLIMHNIKYVPSKQIMKLKKNPVMHTLDIFSSNMMFQLIHLINLNFNTIENLICKKPELTSRSVNSLISALVDNRLIHQKINGACNFNDSYELTIKGNEISFAISMLERIPELVLNKSTSSIIVLSEFSIN